MTDGPTGVRSPEGKPRHRVPGRRRHRRHLESRRWPKAVGAAIAEETRGYGASVLLAPTVNIVRTPRWGRNFETYSEDPLLDRPARRSAMSPACRARAWASRSSISPPTIRRPTASSSIRSVDERTHARDLPSRVRDGGEDRPSPGRSWPRYNKINGTYASENPWLLTDAAEEANGASRAFVVSDWGATHSTATGSQCRARSWRCRARPSISVPKLVKAVAGRRSEHGADRRECPAHGPPDGAQRRDRARPRRRASRRRRLPPVSRPRPLPRRRSCSSTTRALLPLDPAIRTLAVIGPNATIARIQGGGSSAVSSFDAIADAARSDPRRAARRRRSPTKRASTARRRRPPPIPTLFSPRRPTGKETGLQATISPLRTVSGAPVQRPSASPPSSSGSAAISPSAEVIGYVVAALGGHVARAGHRHLRVQRARHRQRRDRRSTARPILDKATPSSCRDNRDVIGFPVPRRTVQVQLGGAARPIRSSSTMSTGQDAL